MSDFQWIFDNAESMSIDRNPIVGQTITRNQTVRAVNRGSGIWKFTVNMPSGFQWTTARNYISKVEALGKFTTGTVQLSSTGQAWITQYLGNSVNSTGFVCSATAGANNITLTTSPTTSSGYKFRAGDIIQIGNGVTVYTVSADCVYNSNTVYLNRAVEITGTSQTVKVGPACTWTVICTQMPTWTLVDYNRVAWSGPFVFYENRV